MNVVDPRKTRNHFVAANEDLIKDEKHWHKQHDSFIALAAKTVKLKIEMNVQNKKDGVLSIPAAWLKNATPVLDDSRDNQCDSGKCAVRRTDFSYISYTIITIYFSTQGSGDRLISPALVIQSS